jgi:hypothetical protein
MFEHNNVNENTLTYIACTYVPLCASTHALVFILWFIVNDYDFALLFIFQAREIN